MVRRRRLLGRYFQKEDNNLFWPEKNLHQQCHRQNQVKPQAYKPAGQDKSLTFPRPHIDCHIIDRNLLQYQSSPFYLALAKLLLEINQDLLAQVATKLACMSPHDSPADFDKRPGMNRLGQLA